MKKLKWAIIKFYRRIKLKFNWNLFYPVKNKIYSFLKDHMQWWPIEFIKNGRGLNYSKKKRVAYYVWEYPALSQTFLQREIHALHKSLGEIIIFCDETSNNFLEENLNIKPIRLLPVDREKLRKSKRYFFIRKPLKYTNLFLYTLFHNYHPLKSHLFDKRTFENAVYLAWLAKQWEINHIHTPWADRTSFVALIASKLLGVSYSLQARAHDIHRKNYLYGLREKFENANFAITNTMYNYEYLKSNIVPSVNGKLNLIYNGINLERFNPGLKKEKSEIIKLLCVARIIEQKGITVLLESCKELKEKGYNFVCNIIGGFEDIYMDYYLKVKKLYTQLNLENNVFFLESLPFNEVLGYFRDSDIFVLPCIVAEDGSRDITPNALIEAMAMKLPVISTEITGIPEIVDNEVNGILIPPNDIKALTASIERLINQPELRKKFAEKAREKVEQRFDINKNINSYVNLFKCDLEN